jgi:hypothetical protein
VATPPDRNDVSPLSENDLSKPFSNSPISPLSRNPSAAQGPATTSSYTAGTTSGQAQQHSQNTQTSHQASSFADPRWSVLDPYAAQTALEQNPSPTVSRHSSSGQSQASAQSQFSFVGGEGPLTRQEPSQTTATSNPLGQGGAQQFNPSGMNPGGGQTRGGGNTRGLGRHSAVRPAFQDLQGRPTRDLNAAKERMEARKRGRGGKG